MMRILSTSSEHPKLFSLFQILPDSRVSLSTLWRLLGLLDVINKIDFTFALTTTIP